MDLHLDGAEMSLVYRVLKNRLEELRSEVHHDHSSVSREYLKHKERILTNVLARFPSDVDETLHRQGFG